MKKMYLPIASIMLSLVLCACGAASSTGASSTGNTIVDNRASNDESKEATTSTTVVDNRKKQEGGTSSEPEAAPVSFSPEDFTSTGYLYENSIGDTLYYIVVKNNSEAVVSVTANGQAKDGAGSILGADSDTLQVLGPNEESILYLYFNDITGVDHVDYELSYSAETYYQPVVGIISLSQTINDRNLSVVATNNGSVNAQFVEAYALFLDAEDNVVYANTTYITDADSEIKPGATLSAQLDCYTEFDHVVCFLTGRSDGSASDASGSLSPDAFDIREFTYSNSYATINYLAVRNNSDTAVGFRANGTAYDAQGNVIGADDCSIEVLGPGEESITNFYFNGVSDVDHIEYQPMYGDTMYNPVVGNLSVVQNINNNNVVLEVTNNGTYPAQFLEAYALFFDASGNVVYADSRYVTDNDSELKSGATMSTQIDCRVPFDHAECFFEGRYH